MKRVIQFHKFYLAAAILSTVLILTGIVGYVVNGGFNLGTDFRAGLNKTVQFGFNALEVSYAGKGTATLTVYNSGKMNIVFTGADIESKTLTFAFSQYPTIGALADALKAVPEVSVVIKSDSNIESAKLLPTFEGDVQLSLAPFVLRRGLISKDEIFITADQLRKAVETVAPATIQKVGSDLDQRYMIRINAPSNDAAFTAEVDTKVLNALNAQFGAEKVISVKTDKVAERFSKTLAEQAIWVVILTSILILLYASFRFKFKFALGAVIAILHDALIMVCFIVWTRMEFNISTIAAILTILGYSINDTIVIFDRIREDVKIYPDKRFIEVLNIALTETLSRTFITALTTFLCVLCLYFFTADTMKDFSLALIVGMISGTYSTIFIASAFVGWWSTAVEEKKIKDNAKVNASFRTMPSKKQDK